MIQAPWSDSKCKVANLTHSPRATKEMTRVGGFAPKPQKFRYASVLLPEDGLNESFSLSLPGGKNRILKEAFVTMEGPHHAEYQAMVLVDLYPATPKAVRVVILSTNQLLYAAYGCWVPKVRKGFRPFPMQSPNLFFQPKPGFWQTESADRLHTGKPLPAFMFQAFPQLGLFQ